MIGQVWYDTPAAMEGPWGEALHKIKWCIQVVEDRGGEEEYELYVVNEDKTELRPIFRWKA